MDKTKVASEKKIIRLYKIFFASEDNKMAVIAFKTKAICMSPTRSFQIRQIKRFNLAINRRQIKENTREKLLGICIDRWISILVL